MERRTRAKGSSKRRPNLTYEELAAKADEAGVGDPYKHCLDTFAAILGTERTRTSLAFVSSIEGSKKRGLNRLPDDSNDGALCFQLYRERFAELAALSGDEVKALMPADSKDWAYKENTPDMEGFQGFFRNRHEIDQLAKSLRERLGQ